MHRDLKLENLLLAKQDDISLVKIADFGLAKHAVNGMQTICGTPQYVAPEVIVGAKGHVYGPGVDMWSAGVVLYILLGGYPPFWSDSEPQLFDMIRKGKYSFADPVWNKVSERYVVGRQMPPAACRWVWSQSLCVRSQYWTIGTVCKFADVKRHDPLCVNTTTVRTSLAPG